MSLGKGGELKKPLLRGGLIFYPIIILFWFTKDCLKGWGSESKHSESGSSSCTFGNSLQFGEFIKEAFESRILLLSRGLFSSMTFDRRETSPLKEEGE